MIARLSKIGPQEGRRYLGWLGWLALCCACTQPASGPQWVEVGEEAGVVGVVRSGSPAKRYIAEANTGGAALFDYNRDGRLDLFVVNGSDLNGFPAGKEPRAALYRNEGGWRFAEVGAEAGVDWVGWGMGCTVADYNADGWPDLLLTSLDRVVLFRNEGGRFEEVAAEAGLEDRGWSTGASFGDFDGDGDLDLYLAKYLEFDFLDLPPTNCTWMGMEVFCGPAGLEPSPDRYFRNEGAGLGWRFTEASREVGLVEEGLYGFGVLALDYDGDGDLDLYVGNDAGPNLLYRNEGGHFTEVGAAAGCAYSGEGRVQASMGIGAGDYDLDGDLDLVVTNFSHDHNTLYQNQGDGTFRDQSFNTLIGRSSLGYLGWGVGFFDWDNDGDEDLFVANGHVYPQVDEQDLGTRYVQPNQLLANQGQGAFADLSRTGGPGLAEVKSSRGSATGDLDNDGDLDLLVVNIDERPSLLRNEGGNRNHWLEVALRAGGANPQAIGARVRLLAGGRWQVRELRAGTGYLSQDEQQLHFGLGSQTRVDTLVVRWPGGAEEVWTGVAADQRVELVRGPATGME